MSAHPVSPLYPANVAWDMPLHPVPMPELLASAVARFPTRPCLDFLGHHYSYAQVSDLTTRLTAGLQQLGVRSGSRVGLFLPNTPYFVFFYYAILAAGGTVVNINPLYAAREIEQLIRDSAAETVVSLDLAALYHKLRPLLGVTPLRRIIVCPFADILPMGKRLLFPFLRGSELVTVAADAQHQPFRELVEHKHLPQPVAIDTARDIAVLQYTGGTTGLPKGAMLTHANLSVNVAQSLAWFPDVTPGAEKMLGVLPFFHVFAMTAVMNFALKAGAEIVMLPRFELKQTIEAIDQKKITLFPAVPTIYAAVADYAHLARYDLSSVRYCISGGAPLPVEVKHRFEKLTGCVLVEGYGLSETSPVATCNPIRGPNRAGSIGLPLPGTRIEIVSLEDRRTRLPVGERGEVCVRGPQVMAGYWQQPEETRAVLAGDALLTGDVGYIDADGYVYIVDRIKDLIIAGGYNVYPRHVEEAIYEHPAVAECAVIGVTDPYRGQTVKAFVALRAGATLERAELLEFLRPRLSPIEMPKLVEFRAQLPKTLIGKVAKKVLQEEEAAHAPRS